MKVYILVRQEYDDTEILAAFDSKAKALDAHQKAAGYFDRIVMDEPGSTFVSSSYCHFVVERELR